MIWHPLFLVQLSFLFLVSSSHLRLFFFIVPNLVLRVAFDNIFTHTFLVWEGYQIEG